MRALLLLVAVFSFIMLASAPSTAGECRKCEKKMEQDWNFCPWCGIKVNCKCPSCKGPVDNPEWKFCPHCAGDLKQAKKTEKIEENSGKPEKTGEKPEKPSVIETSTDHPEMKSAMDEYRAGILHNKNGEGQKAHASFRKAIVHLKNYRKVNPDDPRIKALESTLKSMLKRKVISKKPGKKPVAPAATSGGNKSKTEQPETRQVKSDPEAIPSAEQAEPSRVCLAFIEAIRKNRPKTLSRIVDWQELYRNRDDEKKKQDLEAFKKDFLTNHFEENNRNTLKKMKGTASSVSMMADNATMKYGYMISARSPMKRVYTFELTSKPPGNWYLTGVQVELEPNK